MFVCSSFQGAHSTFARAGVGYRMWYIALGIRRRPVGACRIFIQTAMMSGHVSVSLTICCDTLCERVHNNTQLAAMQKQTHTRNMCSLYQHADSRRVVRARIWPSDLRVSACRGPEIDYMSTNFGADSSSRFPFRAQINRETNRQTDVTEWQRPTRRRQLYSWRGNSHTHAQQ